MTSLYGPLLIEDQLWAYTYIMGLIKIDTLGEEAGKQCLDGGKFLKGQKNYVYLFNLLNFDFICFG